MTFEDFGFKMFEFEVRGLRVVVEEDRAGSLEEAVVIGRLTAEGLTVEIDLEMEIGCLEIEVVGLEVEVAGLAVEERALAGTVEEIGRLATAAV